MASSFVTALSSYVYDTAIGSNFDAFIAKLESVQDCSATDRPRFSDAFSLADGHSDLLDNTLGACLLRSSQKAVGELLRSILHTILEFGILMSDLKQGNLQEYQAIEPLEQLFADFREKMVTFVRLKSVS